MIFQQIKIPKNKTEARENIKFFFTCLDKSLQNTDTKFAGRDQNINKISNLENPFCGTSV